MKQSLLILGLGIIMALISCGDNLDWYPRGEVKIVSFSVYDNTGTRNCILYYRITNTGLSKITTTSLSVQVKTDSGVYYKTALNNTGVLSGKEIYGELIIQFTTNKAKIQNTNDVRISNYFFE